MTTHSLRYLVPGVFCLAVFAAVFGLYYNVHANALFFPVATTSATATTTQTYVLTGSSATTTPVDAYTSSNRGFDKMSFLIQSVASSTGATTTITFQYALPANGINCVSTPNACDWYSDEYFSSNNGAVATTSTIVGIGTAIAYSFPAANTATTSRIIDVPTPTRYVRAIISELGAQSSFWYAWQPVEQNQ